MAQNTLWRLSYTAQQLSDAATNQVPQISGATGNWECWDITTSAWVDTGVPAAGKNPYIGSDHYWYVWDAVQNQYVKTSYSVAQDAVQSVNGVFADAGGNVALGWSNISGANPLTKGGTGKTTAPSGLRALIAACSALTDSTITSSDLLPVQDASDSTNAKKITMDSLTKYIRNDLADYIGINLQSGLAKIQTGNYVGTGTYGSGHPNSITFDFAPKIAWCAGALSAIHLSDYNTMVFMPLVKTSYQSYGGFGEGSPLGKLSEDGKTLSWYSTVSAEKQFNVNGTTYYWFAIG